MFLNILMDQTQHDAVLRARALAGLRRYQEAERPPRMSVGTPVAEVGQARLLQYGATLPTDRAPVVFVPSLINPPHVMDLSVRASMMQWMAAQGHGAMLVDWGHPPQKDSNVDLAQHISAVLLPLLAQIDHPRPPILVGYCLGGTITLAAARRQPVTALATIAAPWHFSAMPQASRDQVAQLWAKAKPMCERLGYVPMELLQSGFWMLDPARTIGKYADFGEMEDGSDAMAAFLALEDWANAGPPLTYAAGRDLFELLYAGDTSGSGQWIVDGEAVDSDRLDCPMLTIASSTDHIVPAACAPRLGEQRMLALGHVGMIVGGRAKAQLWEPLSQWLFNHGG